MTEHTCPTLQRYTYVYTHVCSYMHTQLCLLLCDPMDCSLPGSSVDGIIQARILEWVAISSSRQASQPGNLLHGRWILYHYICIYLFIYVYIYIYIYIHTYLYIYTYTYIFCVYIYMYVYLYVYIGRHTYKYLHKPKSASEISSHSAAFCVTY